jgi:MFS transporter, FHS family, glucose/mannose:H+ symporter
MTGGRRLEIGTVYGIGLFQGLSLVAFPAAATVLTSPTGYALSKTRYGWLFLPQVVMAIVGSLALPKLAARQPLKRILVAGVASDAVAMGLLVGTNAVRTDAMAYPLLLLATACLGLGFGLTLSTISTYAGAFMPDRRDVALTSLNVLLGLGTALSPFLISLFLRHGQWWYLPLLSAAGLVVLLGATLAQPMEAAVSPARRAHGSIPRFFWLFAMTLVVYGIGETMFGNWGTTLLTERGIRSTSATDALAAFWAAVTIGRLVIALSARRIRPVGVYLVLPWAMACALLVAPSAHSALAGILLFAFGGLACSGFFPMTVGYGEASFPDLVELAAGWLIAAYQLGYGLAAFGGGALQGVVSLASLFRGAAVLCVGMAVLAVPIARRQPSRPRPVAHSTGATATAAT